jgi:hypothetical protein
MSKLLKEIHGDFCGRSRPKPDRLFVVEVKGSQEVAPDIHPNQKKYKLSVDFHQFVWCEPHQLDGAIDRFVRALRREMYGEFMTKLDMLHDAFMQGDEARIRDVLRDIEKETEGY